MELRLLDSVDAEIYRELRLKSLLEYPEAFLTTFEIEQERPIEHTRQNLRVSDIRFTIGAFENDKLIGIVTFLRETHPKTKHKGNVYAMYVSPENRRKGVGKALMSDLIERVKKCDGLEQINLVVISNNEAAKLMYKSLGYVVYGIERNALKVRDQYWDEELMVFRLN